MFLAFFLRSKEKEIIIVIMKGIQIMLNRGINMSVRNCILYEMARAAKEIEIMLGLD